MIRLSRLFRAALFTLATGLMSPVQAQTTVQPPSAFEVATIKPVDPTPGVMHMVGVKVFPGGRVTITSFNLKSLVCTAFDIKCWQLSGGDAWMDKDRYDLEARPPETTPATNYNVRHSNFTISDERLRLMLQALLIERFQLKFHRDTTTGQVYLLEKSGRPVPLIPTKEAYAKNYGEGYAGDVGIAGNRWGIYNASMPDVANYLSNSFLHKPVLDRTGMDGAFDFRWTIPDTDPNVRGDDFMNMVQSSYPLFIDAMGLKLTKSTGPIETFVIDHAEPPSPN